MALPCPKFYSKFIKEEIHRKREEGEEEIVSPCVWEKERHKHFHKRDGGEKGGEKKKKR